MTRTKAQKAKLAKKRGKKFAQKQTIPARPEIEGTPEQQVAEAEELELGKPEPFNPQSLVDDILKKHGA